MTQYIHPQFTPEILTTYQGYHLQIFSSGRAKVTLQGEGRSQVHYYAEAPKRDKEAYQRQKVRTGQVLRDHYRIVEQLLETLPDGRVLRFYEQSNRNNTADNAHMVVSIEKDCLWLVMAEVVHTWHLPSLLAQLLLMGQGPKKGVASVFNEYMASLEHDWEDAMFEVDHYQYGVRDQSLIQETRLSQKTLAPQTAYHPTLSPVTPREPQSAPARTQLHHEYPDGSLVDPYEEVPTPEDWALTRAEAVPLFRSADAQPLKEDSEVWENPYDDPIFFVPDPDTGAREDDPYGGEDFSVRAQTTTIGKSTLYTGTSLWEQVVG
ncbi:hypothetical protein [Marivivens sp. JLT3646]|uniref:hypothetical protein n=1 Tax=Marivivens sp. JLT3646 TaxID=1920883 RepID=UPI000800DC9B|nr:hypothetical protein [Marivivens sp. JLT3646]APO88107.1 hypothetical protein BSK21_14460 [Marivivens sp. JLT3646]OBR35399.1 hypothetical protein A9199_10125 [Donghicola sp. JL3646]